MTVALVSAIQEHDQTVYKQNWQWSKGLGDQRETWEALQHRVTTSNSQVMQHGVPGFRGAGPEACSGPSTGPAQMNASGPEHSWEASMPPAPLGHVQSFFLSKLQSPESDIEGPTGRTGNS